MLTQLTSNLLLPEKGIILRIYIVCFLMLLTACSAKQQQSAVLKDLRDQRTAVSESVYYLQHRLLPHWTYTTEGGFYRDLLEGDMSRLKEAAAEMVSQDYADSIASKAVHDGNAILITFPAPKAFANCYYVLIVKNADDYEYFTYEKTMSFSKDDPVVAVLGHWSADGEHGNLGGRTYRAADAFVMDVLKTRK